jgi:diaminopimelate decarboxylase
MTLSYQEGRLRLGPQQFDLLEWAKSAPTPFYIYDLDTIEWRLQSLAESTRGSFPVSIFYAVKSNTEPRVLKHVAGLGAGADVVSGGELKAALAAGFSPERVIFSGVGKSVEEIELALLNGIRQLNVESPQELIRIGEAADRLGLEARVAFRMNPDVNPQTHPYITTGFRENKFGMDEGFLPELEKTLAQFSSLRLVGLTQHIGSQLLSLEALQEATAKTARIYSELKAKGHDLVSLDIGGGIGIQYNSGDESEELTLLRSYGELARRIASDLQCEVLLEPGRSITARAGTLICQVEYIKETATKNFAIVNTGMHHLLRPALYQAHHRILPLQEQDATEPLKVYDVVGPICESSDFLGRDRPFHGLKQGDYLAIADAGAYGMSMASTYNLHELPKEYVIRGGKIV